MTYRANTTDIRSFWVNEPFGKPKYQYLELHKPIVAEQAGTPITIKKVNHLPVLEVKYKA